MFTSQIALSKNGYSEDWKLKTPSDSGGNKDEDFPSSLDAKSTPWRAIAEKFLIKRRTVGERTSDICVEKSTSVVYDGNKVYTVVECKTHSMLCTGPRFMRNKCGPVYTYITGLQKSVITDCECRA